MLILQIHMTPEPALMPTCIEAMQKVMAIDLSGMLRQELSIPTNPMRDPSLRAIMVQRVEETRYQTQCIRLQKCLIIDQEV